VVAYQSRPSPGPTRFQSPPKTAARAIGVVVGRVGRPLCVALRLRACVRAWFKFRNKSFLSAEKIFPAGGVGLFSERAMRVTTTTTTVGGEESGSDPREGA
jgi:hypothetical protein